MLKTITIQENEYNAFFKLKYYSQRKLEYQDKKDIFSKVTTELCEEKIIEAINELNAIEQEIINSLKLV